MNLDGIVSDLRALGIGDRDVLVHSSFKSLGPVEGGPETVVEALIQAVTPAHTLLFPTHTWALTTEDGVIRVDVRETPAMMIGVIPETARRHVGGKRSLHATHSVVAFGPRSQWYTEGHERCETMCGVDSPYWKLGESGGEILMLGCNLGSTTSMHQIEELLKLPNTLEETRREAVLVDEQGVEHHVLTCTHTWLPRNFMRFDEAYDKLGIQRKGKVGNAECRVINAKAMREFLLEVAKKDPLALAREETYVV